MRELGNDKAMDASLNSEITSLQAADDETHDGVVDSADLKAQLDRIEAKLDLQDKQNRILLRHSRVRFFITAIFVVLLCLFIGIMWHRMDSAYQTMLKTCQDVDSMTSSVQTTLDSLDPKDLDALMQQLPELVDKLSQLDTDSLNKVMTRLPDTMDALVSLQKQLSGISGFFGSLSGASAG